MTLHHFVAVFVTIGALVTGLITVVYNLETDTYLEKIKLDEKYVLQLQQESITQHLQTIFSDLLFLSKQNELMQFLAKDSAQNRQSINEEYLEFSGQKRIYDQVRFLDDTGMECCRVNFNRGQPYIVATEDLQPKKGRYYFEDTFNLERGNIFISPFDLNIEQGQIETPLKPTIRFGTPVFDSQGNKRGIIIFNYLGDILIKNIKELARLTLGKMYLLNSESYYLSSNISSDEWAFMYKERSHRKFAADFPEEWKQIQQNETGQLFNSNGVFSYITIRPMLGNPISHNGLSTHSQSYATHAKSGHYYWKLISFIPNEVLKRKTSGLLIKLYTMGLLLFLLASIPSYLVAQAVVRYREHQSKLVHLANFDKLTGLPNRTLFHDRLGETLKQSQRYQRISALLFIDLDGFKAVNDTYGHDYGDLLLIQVSNRLVSTVRKSDTVARLGGDEFVVLLTTIESSQEAEIVANKIIHQIAVPFMIENRKILIGASIGISLFSGNDETPESLIKKADTAMYQAKEQGKSRYQVYA